jgi:hypothetical protein
VHIFLTGFSESLEFPFTYYPDLPSLWEGKDVPWEGSWQGQLDYPNKIGPKSISRFNQHFPVAKPALRTFHFAQTVPEKSPL